MRVKSIPKNWETIDEKIGAGKSSNVNGLLLHGIHKNKYIKFSVWLNYETTQAQLEEKLKDTKTDYMSQLSLGKSPQLLFRYRKLNP